MPSVFKDNFTSAPVAEKPRLVDTLLEENFTRVPLRSIVSDERNPRLPTKRDKENLANLVASVKTHGVQVPIRIFADGEGYRVVYGNRRVSAAIAAGLSAIPALVMDHVPDAVERQRLRALENLERQDLSAAEEAMLVLQLVEALDGGLDAAAQMLGRSVAWVRDRFYLKRLSTKVLDMLANGAISLGHAREIAKLGDGAEQRAIADTVQLTGERGNRLYTIEEVRGMVENSKRSLRVVPWKLDTPFAGKPACDSCPHNSKSDASLFGTSREEAEKGACLNGPCFEAKSRAATKAQEAAVAKVENQLKAESIDRAGAAAAARAAAPEYLKPDSVVRAAARKLQLGAEKPKAAGTPQENPLKRALLKWAKAYELWRGSISDDIDEKTKGSAHHRLLAMLLGTVDFPSYDPPHEWEFARGEWGKRTAPEAETPVGPETAALLDPKACAGPDGLLLLVGRLQPHGYSVLLRKGPDLTARIARAFGIEPPPAPAWDDFIPAALKAAGRADGDPAAKRGVCKACGCTDDDGCEGGCSWIDAAATLCSKCVSVAPVACNGKPFDSKSAGLELEDLYGSYSPRLLTKGVAERIVIALNTTPFACAAHISGSPDTYALVRLIPLERWTGGETIDLAAAGMSPLKAAVEGLLVRCAESDTEFVCAGDGIEVWAPPPARAAKGAKKKKAT